MKKTPESTTFKFILDNQQLFSNLDNLKINDFQRFISVGQIGKQIQVLAKADDYKAIEGICDNHFFDIQFMKLEIEDAFVSALHLRNEDTVEYFLKNGIDLDGLEPGCIVEVCYSLQYLKNDPPIKLLHLLLQYGGNPRFAQTENSDTSLHISSKYGIIPFIELLLEYGADINAANDQKKTPLGLAIQNKRTQAIQLLKKNKGSEKWNI